MSLTYMAQVVDFWCRKFAKDEHSFGHHYYTSETPPRHIRYNHIEVRATCEIIFLRHFPYLRCGCPSPRVCFHHIIWKDNASAELSQVEPAQ
jgi:hypothetical protein